MAPPRPPDAELPASRLVHGRGLSLEASLRPMAALGPRRTRGHGRAVAAALVLGGEVTASLRVAASAASVSAVSGHFES